MEDSGGVVELHAHYPMHVTGEHLQTALTDSDLWRAKFIHWLSKRANYEGPGGEPGVTLPLLREGDVRVAVSVAYLPFAEIDLNKWRCHAPPDDEYHSALRRQLAAVEADLERQPDAQVVRTTAELDAALADNRTAFVHAIEGGFMLGATEEAIAENVRQLADDGVLYVTLAHLFYRRVATNAPALPFISDRLYRILFRQPPSGLTKLGRAAVAAMGEHKVLVDVTHCSDAALKEVLDADVPVIASHMACRLKNGLEYSFSEETIRAIAARDGVMGVIACRHYITDDDRLPHEDFKDTVDAICVHIDRLREVTGTHDHTALGSDHDGYIKPALKGLTHSGHMKDLQGALTDRYGSEIARRICSENALRVIRRALDR